MTFTRNDAVQLITYHKANQALLQQVLDTAKDTQSSLQFEASLEANEYANALNTELFHATGLPSSLDLPSPNFLKYLSILNQLEPLQQRALALQERDSAVVQQNLIALSPATSRLSWFFSNRTSKALAERAYEKLRQLASGSYLTQYAQLRSSFERVTATGPDEATLNFELDREAFQRTYSLLPATGAKGSSPALVSLKARLDHIEDAKLSLSQQELDLAAVIKQNAGKLRQEMTFALLEQIPIESMKREIPRLRTKTLTEHGYLTVAHIQAASAKQLEEINGISRNGARLLKEAAEQYGQNLASGAALKLNPDDSSEDSDRIVRAVQQYRLLNGYRKQWAQLERNQSHKIAEGAGISDEKVAGANAASATNTGIAATIRRLRRLNGPAWSLLAETQKEQLRQTVSFLQDHYCPAYEDLISDYAIAQTRIAGAITADAWTDFVENSIEYYQILEEILPGILGNKNSTYGLPEALATQISEQKMSLAGLNCTLRGYQEWGVKYVLHQGSVILGDEMGLGKTVQAIAVMVALRNAGATHFVVVSPAAVLTNWDKEISEKSDLKAVKIHGEDREEALARWLADGGVAVTTFETLKHFVFPEGFRFGLLIVDEAHYVKNPEAQRTQHLRDLTRFTPRHLLMTGTALENKVEEMVSLVRLLRPQLATSLFGVAHMLTAETFREKVATVYLRRKREDVLGELPDLVESSEWCELSREEWLKYRETVTETDFAAMRRVSWNAPDLTQSAKAERLLDIVEQAGAEGRKVIVFSFFLQTLESVTELLGSACIGLITGSVPPARRQELVDEFTEAPTGSVLVAQIQSGGTGLNIQAASVVVFCEPQLKPSSENQALSRAYRMGQARSVFVYRLLAERTVDERIMELLKEKQQVFAAFADDSVAGKQATQMETSEPTGDVSKAEGEQPEVDSTGINTILQEELERVSSDSPEMFPHHSTFSTTES
ncbi:DEAD/DEAH box helicase [Boudabousia marimammalium]|uniref:Helicase SNF2 n=1 Tax=Boudabousia marimammalium TaxID=156892 RepID=A0A1Q5PKH5_9ACTO|nr:DEAD/DEAH box helicase [Boudabousia marimammalium]OKL46709.1 hypothetical protein BM477_07090 [Boudabousia marimammalium]